MTCMRPNLLPEGEDITAQQVKALVESYQGDPGPVVGSMQKYWIYIYEDYEMVRIREDGLEDRVAPC